MDVAIMKGGSNAVGKEGAGGGTVDLGGAGTRAETDGKGVGMDGAGTKANTVGSGVGVADYSALPVGCSPKITGSEVAWFRGLHGLRNSISVVCEQKWKWNSINWSFVSVRFC